MRKIAKVFTKSKTEPVITAGINDDQRFQDPEGITTWDRLLYSSSVYVNIGKTIYKTQQSDIPIVGINSSIVSQ